ncbi:ABC transporter permease [Actinopolymorpha alba]|uniref:ABC transporter permease n=1 Tax=Actinopolymorpha alba TaxID=533267 RepID=UPI00035CF482|nr:ABC transporter permease [Actinopolymorpha alba]
MLGYIGRRILLMIPMIFAISIVSFVIIQLPPGDYLTTVVAQLSAQGDVVDQAQLAALKAQYGLDQPMIVQYWTWISRIVMDGDFGQSFIWNKPVSELLAGKVPLSAMLTISALLVTWVVAFPIGVYSAVRQYSVGDYVATTIGFLGIAIPEFLIALILMWVSLTYFGQSVGGLLSPEYRDSNWNLGKLLDLLGHLWVPILVLGAAGTAGLIRVLRANLLDELHKPYVIAARARGMRERRLTVKYPLRVALIPFFSTVGWILPGLVSGEVIVAQVLSLDTAGPLLLNALKAQDMYLAGSIVLIVSVLTVIGTLISDILLAWLDPRVRLRYR